MKKVTIEMIQDLVVGRAEEFGFVRDPQWALRRQLFRRDGVGQNKERLILEARSLRVERRRTLEQEERRASRRTTVWEVIARASYQKVVIEADKIMVGDVTLTSE